MSYAKKDYAYTLPSELIAQEAIHPHHDARLLVVERSNGEIIGESTFYHLDNYMPSDRVIFFNNSRVIPSRLRLVDAKYVHTSGHSGSITEGEIFFLSEKDETHFEALVKPGNKFKIGTQISAFGALFHVEEITETGRILRIEGKNIISLLKEYGELPLPPYIAYKKTKEEDYQTVFAKHDGSVAAPTASLHFTRELLEKLPNQKEYITLHVGLGTFRSIDADDIRDYEIHKESIEVNLDIFSTIFTIHQEGKKIVAVGTTVCRSLESLPYLWNTLDEEIKKMFDKSICAYWDALIPENEKKDYIHQVISIPLKKRIQFDTNIYITPGYSFHIVDELITNFHLGESSLIVLVSAFLGYKETMNIYHKAREKNYRFFSFGDGMYIRSKL